MKVHRYPGAGGHAEAHRRLLSEALAIAQAHGAGDLGAARETVARLRAWLLDHVETVDAAFDAWTRANRITLE
jgi:hemerythrin